MLLRDPVHGLVAFEGPLHSLVTALLDTREVQRLRRVRQLGLTSLVFPGAEHSRFSHAIGTAHVMVRWLDRVRVCAEALPAELRPTPEDERDAVASALLHDVGHGPFSHLFEQVLPGARHHEEWTREVIVDDSTEVHRVLEQTSAGMSSRVAALLSGNHRLGYLSRALSGLLDVDRCDYLLRDSHMTGVKYGLYDLDWLLQALAFAEVPQARKASDRFVLAVEGRKGLQPIESFFLARNFMYHQVYHHKATRAAECLVRAIFVRLRELVLGGTALPHLPVAIKHAALGAPVGLSEYLELDDDVLLCALGDWSRLSGAGADATLGSLASAFRGRHLPKTAPLPDDEANRPMWDTAHARVRDLAEAKGFRPDLSVWLDVPSDVPYPEPEGDVPDGMWVVLRHQPLKRLGDTSFMLHELRNKRIVRPRLIFPPELRADANQILEDLAK